MDTLRGDLGRYFCAWELCRNEKNSIMDVNLLRAIVVLFGGEYDDSARI